MSVLPWFDAAVGFEREVLARDGAVRSVFEEFRVSGVGRVRAAGAVRVGSPWRGITSSSGMRSAVVESEVFALWGEYAARVAGVVAAADAARWSALVGEGAVRSGRGLLVDEVWVSAVGALSLREAWGFRPVVPNRAFIDCGCGFAESGVVGRGLCVECGEVIVRRWAAEEVRLLAGVPDYGVRVEEILVDTEARQDKQIGRRSETPASDLKDVRSRGGRRLGRLSGPARRRGGSEGRGLPSERWRGLGQLGAKAMQTSVRAESVRAPKRGLGAAGLAALALKSDRDVLG